MEMNDTLTNFIDQVAVKDFAKAEPTFQDMMTAKIGDALDAEKIAVANIIHNGGEDAVVDNDATEVEIDAPEVEEIDNENK